jgi:hypothetical protein
VTGPGLHAAGAVQGTAKAGTKAKALAAILFKTVLVLAIVLAAGWGALALWFQLPQPLALLLGALWCLVGAASVLALVRARQRRTTALVGALAAALMLFWWQSLTPSHERAWADDVARLLESSLDGDQLTLRNVRAFDWQTETSYTPRWETRHYDLAGLQSADLILSYWMGPHIAHTLVSFGFSDGRQLVFSLEIRKEQGEEFSAIGGFFRQFEQVIIAADESDIVKTRSNARGEQVYLYRLRATPEQLRSVLLDYLDRARALRRQPEFYNTLTSNCTTILFELARQIDPALPLDYRLLASGHFAEYAYDQGALTPGLPYATLQQRGHINARAHKAGPAADDFSRAIRAGVPGIP